MGSLHLTRDDLASFAAALDSAERWHGRPLPFAEARSLGKLYRRHAAELARMRQRQDDPQALRYRNALCIRAHTLLMATAPVEARRSGGTTHWAALIWPALVTAFVLLAIGMVVGNVLARRDRDALTLFVPSGLGYTGASLERLATSPAARAEFLAHESSPTPEKAIFGSFLFFHNTRVGLLSLATGMLAAIPTILLQLYNGITLGAFASIFLRDAWPVAFFAWILPHGIPEFTAICLCAAAGLLLGRAVVAPGNGGVRAALGEVITPVLILAATSLPLFAIAAIIESFVRQSALGNLPRLLLAFAMLILVVRVLARLRRAAHDSTVDTSWLRALTTPIQNASPDNG